MSDIKMQDIENKNEWINWIEEAIHKEHIKYYEYKEFNNFQEIGTGGFEEIIRELKNQREVDYHDNIICCHGITKFESAEYHVSNNYMLVMEYANNGSLRSYLEKNFGKLTWDDKYIMAYQLACAVSCLHNKGIVHRDLHSGERYDVGLALEILQGLRETVVPDTPENYVEIYTKCWDGEPDNRPNIYQVVDRLKEMITKTDAIANILQSLDKHEFSKASLSINGLESQRELSQLIQNFNKINTKEIDPMIVLTQHFVADCYLSGTGTTKNKKLGFEYYEKVANKNFARGQLEIGYCYENGIGQMIAQHNLGKIYENDFKRDDNALKT
ncbi:kinase-like domain-containing protein [Rhizophagus irregularis DAOM 181602=DAOM 197198]|nr:kinase-like domain-containing protein [Rhizophagus irregularis DAOM 181602=DAOM 197198]